MAKTDARTAQDKSPEGESKPKKGKGLVIALAMLVVFGAGGGGAWWWLNRDAGAAQASVVAPRPPVFMNLEPFTVNLAEEGGEHYLQTSLVFHVSDEKVVETMKSYLPVIRNRLLLLLSSKRPSELTSPEGKAKLVEEVTGAVRESIPGAAPERGIVQAYIAGFVIQ